MKIIAILSVIAVSLTACGTGKELVSNSTTSTTTNSIPTTSAFLHQTEAITLTPIITFVSTPSMTPTSRYPIIATQPKCPPFDAKLPDPNIPSNYIGRHYDSFHLPDGLTDMGGQSISWDYPDHLGLQYVRQENGQTMIWLERITCYDPFVGNYWEIIDAIELPPPYYPEDIAFCFRNLIETDINAVGYYDINSPIRSIGGSEGWKLSKIIFAWHIDREALQFVEDSPEELVCLYPLPRG